MAGGVVQWGTLLNPGSLRPWRKETETCCWDHERALLTQPKLRLDLRLVQILFNSSRDQFQVSQAIDGGLGRTGSDATQAEPSQPNPTQVASIVAVLSFEARARHDLISGYAAEPGFGGKTSEKKRKPAPPFLPHATWCLLVAAPAVPPLLPNSTRRLLPHSFFLISPLRNASLRPFPFSPCASSVCWTRSWSADVVESGSRNEDSPMVDFLPRLIFVVCVSNMPHWSADETESGSRNEVSPMRNAFRGLLFHQRRRGLLSSPCIAPLDDFLIPPRQVEECLLMRPAAGIRIRSPHWVVPFHFALIRQWVLVLFWHSFCSWITWFFCA